jgi:hypothetical protein
MVSWNLWPHVRCPALCQTRTTVCTRYRMESGTYDIHTLCSHPTGIVPCPFAQTNATFYIPHELSHATACAMKKCLDEFAARKDGESHYYKVSISTRKESHEPDFASSPSSGEQEKRHSSRPTTQDTFELPRRYVKRFR